MAIQPHDDHQLDTWYPFRMYLYGRGLADSTVREYVKWLDRLQRWADDNRVLTGTLQRHHVRQWADATIPYSFSSRKGARSAVGHWCAFAGVEDMTTAIRCPRKPRPMPSALPDHQVDVLEQHAFDLGMQARREGVAVMFGLYLAMRRIEIAQASWTSDAGDRWVWTRAKTGDLAALPVHPRLRQVLSVYREHCSSTYLFVGDRGRPHVTPASVWKWTVDVGRDVDIELTTHQLRHSSISRVVEKVGLRVGQEWAGHRDPETTSTYAKVWPQQMQDAMEALDWNTGQEERP